jgi:hypothetical protein
MLMDIELLPCGHRFPMQNPFRRTPARVDRFNNLLQLLQRRLFNIAQWIRAESSEVALFSDKIPKLVLRCSPHRSDRMTKQA